MGYFAPLRTNRCLPEGTHCLWTAPEQLERREAVVCGKSYGGDRWTVNWRGQWLPEHVDRWTLHADWRKCNQRWSRLTQWNQTLWSDAVLHLHRGSLWTQLSDAWLWVDCPVVLSWFIKTPRVMSLTLTAPCGAGAPLFPLVHLLHLSPFYFSISFIGFTYFLLLSIPSLSTRIVPLRFQAGGRRRRPNLGLVCVLLCNLCSLYSLVKMHCGVFWFTSVCFFSALTLLVGSFDP